MLVKVFINHLKKLFFYIHIYKFTKSGVEPYNFPFSIFMTICLIITISTFFIHIQIIIIINIIRYFRLQISKLLCKPAIFKGFNIHFTTFMKNILLWWYSPYSRINSFGNLFNYWIWVIRIYIYIGGIVVCFFFFFFFFGMVYKSCLRCSV